MRLIKTPAFLLTVLAMVAMGFATPAPAATAPADQNHTLVLISIDGFGWNFASMTDTPAIDRLAAEGANAEALQPVFPTLTFPNHYSIATGRLPVHHGIVANDFPADDRQSWYHYKDRDTVQDGSWYEAEPIWVTAERNGIRTAAFYFVGTEADVFGTRPQRWKPFDPKISSAERVDAVISWLREPADKRPGLVTLYFDEVDNYTHWKGVGSEESLQAIRNVDRELGRLLAAIDALPDGQQVHIVLVSDHGQGSYDPDRDILVLDQSFDLDGIMAVDNGMAVSLYFPDGKDELRRTMHVSINQGWNCGRAWYREELPTAWRTSNRGRYPDLLVQGDPGCAVLSSERHRKKITAGDHGWPPEMPDMRGIFHAWGPRIEAGARLDVIHVTDIHPLLTRLLGLPAGQEIDGDPTALQAILRPESSDRGD